MDVVALGELLIDFTTVSSDSDGYPTMAAHAGGAPTNFLGALAKYGAKTAFFAKVGNDAFGQILVKTIENAGIDPSGIVIDDNFFTTLAFVTLDEQGDRSFSFARKPGADTQLRFEDLDLRLIDQTRVFHFGTLSLTDEPSRNTTYQAVAYAKKAGKLISFDPNLRKPLWKNLQTCAEQMLWGLSQADIVKISDEEVEFLFNLNVEDGAQHILDNYGVKLVYVTCGAKGCYFKNQKASGMVSALQGIHVVDTTGAGDIFGGSALWMLLQQDQSPEQLDETVLRKIVNFACTAASLSTTKPGGMASVPTLERIKAYL